LNPKPFGLEASISSEAIPTTASLPAMPVISISAYHLPDPTTLLLRTVWDNSPA